MNSLITTRKNDDVVSGPVANDRVYTAFHTSRSLSHLKYITKAEAIRIIYRSKTYQKLERESTKLWHLGPVALLEILTEELNITSMNN